MSGYVGIDVGAVSATAVVMVPAALAATLTSQGYTPLAAQVDRDVALLASPYRRTKGKPLQAARELLDQILAAVGAGNVTGICLTGSGSKMAAAHLGTHVVNEFKALASGLGVLGIDARTVFEMGGESSKYLRLSRNGDGSYGIIDYSTNGDCAAGTGSFIDQQANRLKYTVEEIGPLVLGADRAASVAGRCSVFAKSDMIHAQQKGYTPAEVLRGLCNAVARNFRTAVVRSHPVEGPVVFLGGVAANAAVVRAMRETFGLSESEMAIPEAFTHVAAAGAAMTARGKDAADLSLLQELRAASDSDQGTFPMADPLTMANVQRLADRLEPYAAPADGEKIDAYMGIDIGSVSTNVVLIDEDCHVITDIYVRTQGRPIQVVSDALLDVQSQWGDRLNILGVGTTGSGRELIGELVGADTINDEITAHKTGATLIGRRMLGRVPDTIFEIGGQDSKFISLQDGVVVDFTMNEACAAGTGSFLEERAEELDIPIKGVFAELALSSDAPIRLGERCTVFMERDVNSYVQRGASKADLVAGLAYSVVYNYINRVVRGRKIGDCIFFQGGTAYNDAVAAAFAAVTGKDIIIPPYNGVMGAVGAALLAREKMSPALRAGKPAGRRIDDMTGRVEAGATKPPIPMNAYVSDRRTALPGRAAADSSTGVSPVSHMGVSPMQPQPDDDTLSIRQDSHGQDARGTHGRDARATEAGQTPAPHDTTSYESSHARSRFRGYDTKKVDYTLREFTCKSCSNTCQIQEFNVEGSKTYWGDKCSDKFRKAAKSATKPVIADLFAMRSQWLLDDAHLPPVPATAKAVGIPMTMFAHDLLPFWRTLLAHLGYRTILSDPTNKKIVTAGLESAVAEPCFPLIVAHGHVANLLDKTPDFILLPNILSGETKWRENEAHLCPWHQTLPFVVRRAAGLEQHIERFLTPVIRFREGRANVTREMQQFWLPRGHRKTDVARAVSEAFAAQDRFSGQIARAADEALTTLNKHNTPGVVLLGRPYNVHDAGVNLSVATKLRECYGVNVIPVDSMPTNDVDIRDINSNMFWNWGRKIIAAAKLVKQNENLHIIYITNFKCGPDSFIKHFIRSASGKPFLSLQFDGHSNDAGMMTRCEAYLDSKGILRPWKKEELVEQQQMV